MQERPMRLTCTFHAASCTQRPFGRRQVRGRRILVDQGKAGNALETEVKEKIAEKTGLGDNPEEIKLVVKRGRRYVYPR